MKIKFLFFAILIFHFPAIASQSPPSPKCAIKGIFLEESKREVAGQGISEGHTFTYHDIKIEIVNSDYMNETEKLSFQESHGEDYCNIEEEYAVFQRRDLRENETWNLLLNPAIDSSGKCISAETNWSGDGNFMSGNWIYNIEIIDSSECES